MKSMLERFRSVLPSRNLWILAFLVMVLLYILPIWLFKYFPSQDGPCHIYNSFILRHYNNPEYEFSEIYGIRKSLIPNWASSAIMMLLMYLVPPLIAEKILLTGYIILMAGSMLYLLNVAERGRTPLVFLGFPFIYYRLLLIGFYNYSLSVAMFILCLGYWWKHFDSFNVKNTIVLGFLLILLYFCHPVGIVVALLSIAGLALSHLLPRLARWKQTVLSLLSMFPAIGLVIYYLAMPLHRGVSSGGRWSLSSLLRFFIRTDTLAYYSQSQVVLARSVAVIFGVLFLYTLVRDHVLTREWRFALRLRRKDFLLLLGFALFALYLLAPNRTYGGSAITERLSFLPFLIIIPWLSWDMPKIARGVLGAAIMLLAAIYLIHGSYYHMTLSRQVEVYVSGYDAVEKNKVVMPLTFNNRAGAWKVGVLHHAAAHYGYERGSIDVFNYEAGLTNYFPTYFKPGLHRPPSRLEGKPKEVDIHEYAESIDYIIAWRLPAGGEVEASILGDYELVRHNGDLKIFGRKRMDKTL